ncbi:carbamoyltransferase HypF [Parasutterella secunda]|uniref:Carbamoyltransferase HypF n=1 Tax=Parasutterella secunda TaxID=626947 RepID=A0ABS2GT96_9BURK|nr:carbamoyltransferase HypF [Parasutterella secunda]MBM6928396.1 carbamoyltransferase HypF [Parasutterella secunda]
MIAKFFRINGLVQGVGFRPTVYRIARELGLNGEVFNDAEGVGVVLEGEDNQVLAFPEAMRQGKPPLARIDYIHMSDTPVKGYTDFTITESQEGKVKTAITADAATCKACLEDMFTPGNRRYRYAFTNCTHCGPRFTITKHLPYDRPQTTMAPFKMCPQCQKEYTDPLDRRFHAQPNACPVCGPELCFENARGEAIEGDPIDLTIDAIRAGKIVAVKGLGGFHLVCDARNPQAVAELRQRKGRDEKALAVMMANAKSAALYAEISEAARSILESVARPIVLLPKKANIDLPGIADGLSDIGIMLPYTPVHWLLFHSLAGKPDGAQWTESLCLNEMLVMTSANRSGEPLVIGNDEALEKLSGIADFFLLHNRDILTRCDDSVVRMVGEKPIFIRRSRGYAPEAIKFDQAIEPTFAAGAYLKNTAALTRDEDVFLTQHIGDLENTQTTEAYREAASHLAHLYEIKPQVVVSDAHPDFFSTRYAAKLADETHAKFFSIYHHAAHIGVAMAELNRKEPTLGLALDGVGLGPGKEIWGGELLMVKRTGFERWGTLLPLPLPGGDIAAHEPRRMGASVLTLLKKESLIEKFFPTLPNAAHFGSLVTNCKLSPASSSVGRLFDALSALLGLCDIQHDEARAAMLLESTAYKAVPHVHRDGFEIKGGQLNLLPFLDKIVCAHSSLDTQSVSQWAADFHATLACGLVQLTLRACRQTDYRGPIALTGGCMANRILTACLVNELHAQNMESYYPQKVPAGDGGLALGQVWLAHLALEAQADQFIFEGDR